MITKIAKLVKDLTEYDIVYSKEEETHTDHIKEVITLNLNDDIYKFLMHMQTKHKCKFIFDYYPILWVVLHEIGHEKTFDDITPQDWEDYAFINFMYDIGAGSQQELESQYYNSTVEWCATDWAIWYVETHKEELKAFKIER